MQVQCVICDNIESIPTDSVEAKRLINRRMHTYLCDECNQRIASKTKQRHETGKFKLYSSEQTKKKHLT